jgi:hypothetical protein
LSRGTDASLKDVSIKPEQKKSLTPTYRQTSVVCVVPCRIGISKQFRLHYNVDGFSAVPIMRRHDNVNNTANGVDTYFKNA